MPTALGSTHISLPRLFQLPYTTLSFPQVPAALQEAVKHTLEAVAAPYAARSTLSSAEASAVWGALADCMRDPSELGSRAGRGWLVQLLVAAAEHELARSGSPQGGEGGVAAAAAAQQQKQQLQDGGEGGDGEEGATSSGSTSAAAGGQAPPPALLPEVTPHGGCQLQPGRRGMLGQDALRELLMRALATTPDNRAADCFMAAVGSLLSHVRLRCAAAGWEAEDGWAGGGSSGGGGGAGSATPGSSARLAGSASTPQLGGQRSHDSLPDAEASAAKIVASESATSVHSPPFDAQGSGWRVSMRA